MHELDGVLDSEDVPVLVLVLVVDHGSKCGGFARAGGARDEYHTPRIIRDVLEDVRAVKLFESQDFGRDGPEDSAGAAVLVKGVYAKSGEPGDLERKVRLEKLLVVFALLVVHDVVNEIMNGLVLQRRHVYAPHVAVHANHGRQSGRQMHVGGAVFHRECEQLANVHA